MFSPIFGVLILDIRKLSCRQIMKPFLWLICRVFELKKNKIDLHSHYDLRLKRRLHENKRIKLQTKKKRKSIKNGPGNCNNKNKLKNRYLHTSKQRNFTQNKM